MTAKAKRAKEASTFPLSAMKIGQMGELWYRGEYRCPVFRSSYPGFILVEDDTLKMRPHIGDYDEYMFKPWPAGSSVTWTSDV